MIKQYDVVRAVSIMVQRESKAMRHVVPSLQIDKIILSLSLSR
jgi:hypothetical protein